MEIVLAFDLGGTKVICGAIDQNGQILNQRRELVPKEKGPLEVINLMASMGKEFLSLHPSIKKCAVASAGPLDPRRGVLLDPTNLTTNHQGWGEIPIAQELSKALGLPVQLENDAAAAVLACAWKAEGQDCKNLITLTLGTGLGVGILANGLLVRSGRHLHPEAGHIILNYDDPTAPCGCGNFGCAEAYLSGVNFCQRLAKKLNRPYIKGQEAILQAQQGNKIVLQAFSEYSEIMAQAITNYVVLFAPEKIIFAGGFSQAGPQFLPKTQERIKELLKRRRVGEDLLPQLIISSLKDEMVLLGAARIALL